MNKALFLDRDGVINLEKSYVHKIEDFEFIDGIFELTKYFQDKCYLIIVITNQAGIGRGYYTEEDFHKLNDWMIDQFKQRGILITEVYYCPFHPTHGIGKYKKDSFDRKPNPGMILKAARKYNINLSESILIGDKESDIEAGKSAGVGMNILFLERNNNKLADVIAMEDK
ncbi:HAD family hydrolase [Cytobacillus sp.]|uniref:D-glycero-alpha-D-manno-heptose-1,7-bisphosphate 7-phosphatase n=1 Tax=Cytobacillus sp. TaxID=2675269 RepID=UPI0028BE2D8F|nr:HAD family hydrolase [Cytobacillus sp.]